MFQRNWYEIPPGPPGRGFETIAPPGSVNAHVATFENGFAADSFGSVV